MVDLTTVTHDFLFGSFRLSTAQRVLLEGGRPVRLGSRALDILIALIERPGELIGKRELIQIVWPNTVVVEANLTVHVAALRRALGDGQKGNRFIINSPGRGYRFVAPIAVADEPKPSSAQIGTTTGRHNLPAQLTRLIGRAEAINDIVQRLHLQRLVTIIGPGGIGKTAVALDVAENVMPLYEDGVWLIDFARLSDPCNVPSALASVLKLEIRSDNPIPALITALKDKHMLLVLDNCEHVVDAAAALTTAILQGSPKVHILATGREPLRIAGEWMHRLATLESPPASPKLNASEVLEYSAVQLFVERAAASVNDFELSEEDAPSAGEVCRRLDGIPLAIEFAAASVESLGVRGVASGLDDRLRLLRGGRRGALSRNQTIGAALDWSYQLVPAGEQDILRRLAIFVGGFTLESARAVVGGKIEAATDIDDGIANLVMKSLVTADVGQMEIRFRLLETTRGYALTKLVESREAETLARQHAAHYRDLVEAGGDATKGDYAGVFGFEIDNIRAALTWAFSPKGDGSIAVSLAAASAPIWLDMSLLTECHGWMGKALDALHPADRGARREMVLQTALGLSLMFTKGMSRVSRAALTRASELAEHFNEYDYQLRIFSGLAILHCRMEDFQGALALSRRFEKIANQVGDSDAKTTADCMLSASLYFLGRYSEVLTYTQRARRRVSTVPPRGHTGRSGIDYSLWSQVTEALVLWQQGLPDQSLQTTREVLANAQSGGHPVSICFALTWCGCNISLWLGDMETAEASIRQLKVHAQEHSLNAYFACALAFEGRLLAKRGEFAAAEQLFRTSFDGLRESEYAVLHTSFLSGFAEVLAAQGFLDESLSAASEALQRTERGNAFWWMPEALRIKGEILRLSNKQRPAEDHLGRSFDLASQQHCLSWQLRAAMSLARSHHARGSDPGARDLLQSVYARFTEGFGTADLTSAREILETWPSSKARQRNK